MPHDVALHVIGTDDVDAVVAIAVREAAPDDVMPPDDQPSPSSWTPERSRRYATFLRSRLVPLPDGRRETSYLVRVGGVGVGVARLVPSSDDAGSHETGLWLGRPHRGHGHGTAVLALLVDEVRDRGGVALVAETTTGNAPALGILRTAGAVVVVEEPGSEVRRARMAVR